VGQKNCFNPQGEGVSELLQYRIVYYTDDVYDWRKKTLNHSETNENIQINQETFHIYFWNIWKWNKKAAENKNMEAAWMTDFLCYVIHKVT
jgi:hypothetical protein